MRISIIGMEADKRPAICSELEQVTLNSVRNVLPDSAIEQACRDESYTYRRRTLTPIVTVLHMILASIWPEESFQASLQLIWDHFAGACPWLADTPPHSGSLAKARARLPLGLWRRITEYLAAKAETLSESFAAWHGHRVVLADGTCVSMSDTPVGKLYRRKNSNLPATVRVRLIRATVRTRGRREVMWFVTSLLDEVNSPADEIVELYARRWRIETVFLQLKRRLSADVLRSKTPDGVRKELAACVAALNIVRTILLEAAVTHGQDPMRLSFVGAVRAILAFAPLLASAPSWKLLDIYDAMLLQIAMSKVPDRPGRQEPRAVRREWKHYPKLRITRDEWRQRWAA